MGLDGLHDRESTTCGLFCSLGWSESVVLVSLWVTAVPTSTHDYLLSEQAPEDVSRTDSVPSLIHPFYRC